MTGSLRNSTEVETSCFFYPVLFWSASGRHDLCHFQVCLFDDKANNPQSERLNENLIRMSSARES